jgi:hypothetical protein
MSADDIRRSPQLQTSPPAKMLVQSLAGRILPQSVEIPKPQAHTI